MDKIVSPYHRKHLTLAIEKVVKVSFETEGTGVPHYSVEDYIADQVKAWCDTEDRLIFALECWHAILQQFEPLVIRIDREGNQTLGRAQQDLPRQNSGRLAHAILHRRTRHPGRPA